MKIIKILNNNAVVCRDDDGKEIIAMGKGCAFQQKAGNDVDETKIEKTFVTSLSAEKNSKFQKIIQNMPLEDVLLAQKIIERTQAMTSQPFNDTIYITLTDHLSAALERQRSGIIITNPLTSAIKSFYPKEFEMGVEAVRIVKEATGVELSLDEVAFFTMHFVTAELGDGSVEFNAVLSFVGEISMITRSCLKNPVDETSISWQRFMTHLSFFAQRVMTGKDLSDTDSFLYDSVSKSFPHAFSCVKKIVSQIEKKYSYVVGKDEQSYLMIHVNRLQREFGIKNMED